MPKKTVMTEAIEKSYSWTTESIAEDLGMKPAYFRVWKTKIEQDGKIAKPAIGSLLCIQDPDSGNRLLYSDAYVDKLRELRGKVNKRDRILATAEKSLKNAILKITVPVFDQNIADVLMRRFKTEEGIQEHFKDHIKDMAIPALKKIEAIKKKYEEEMRRALDAPSGDGSDKLEESLEV